jgi:hypothetical protein
MESVIVTNSSSSNDDDNIINNNNNTNENNKRSGGIGNTACRLDMSNKNKKVVMDNTFVMKFA